MNSSLPDLQASIDERGVSLDEVGIAGLRHPIVVLDRHQAKQETVAEVSMSVSVDETTRGAHLSRFLELLESAGGELTIRTVPALLRDLRVRCNADAATLSLRFPYFIEKHAPVSGARGLLDVDCRFDFVSNGSDETMTMTVTVPVTTLCPCSRAVSDYGAHNQRCYVTMTVQPVAVDEEPDHGIVWIEELVAIAEQSASAPIYPTLKRTDERAVTMQAFDKPAFVEDVVRDVAVHLRQDGRVRAFSIEAASEESIHNHQAYARTGSPVRL